MHLQRWEKISFVVGMVRHSTQIDIISFTNLTAFALYNHACYNIEILNYILSLFYVFYFNINVFFTSMVLSIDLSYVVSVKQNSSSNTNSDNFRTALRRPNSHRKKSGKNL